ncbi:MFS transporter [Agrilactobacillus fermenti]|uniref:MFS transporter n=1 Tax=Agrilactobacillus fermenti TaxID=2586909 RepID=UPI003A5BA9E0
MKFTKTEKSWILYDWANSAYSIVTVTAILPIYFKSIAHADGVANATATAYWGYANSVGTLIISLLAPLLGAIADYQSYKKKLFNFFNIIAIISTLLLVFVPARAWLLLLVVFVISTVGYAGANIFYDGFLTDVTSTARMDRVSAQGYSMGYLGGVIPFVLIMLLQLTRGFGFLDSTGIVNFGFIMTTIWWLIFSVPLMLNVSQTHYLTPVPHIIRTSWRRVTRTFKTVWRDKYIVWFLAAYFFYIDGVDTIFKMATSVGADYGLSTTSLMLVLLMVQLIAVPFSVLFGHLANRIGNKRSIGIAIFIYLVICIWGYFMKSELDFWILAFLVGTSQGGIQALSRSHYAKIIPSEKANEYFGIYNIFGKFSAIIGPALFGIFAQLTGATKYGILSIILLFIIGGLLFIKVPSDRVSATK